MALQVGQIFVFSNISKSSISLANLVISRRPPVLYSPLYFDRRGGAAH